MRFSKIRWCVHTWNYYTGCTHAVNPATGQLSPACGECYAEQIAEQKRGTKAFPFGFDLMLRPHKMDFPLRVKEPSRIFVNSMSDAFHEKIPFSMTDQAFDVMEKADRHIYQILTKRPWIMAAYIKRRYTANDRKVPGHIWLGVSVESDEWIWRMDQLRDIPCEIRFVSAEPLIGPLTKLNLDSFSWIIVGGMSGPNWQKYPMDLEWAREILVKCKKHKPPVAYFFKQVNARFSEQEPDALGRVWEEYPQLNSASIWWSTHREL